MWVPLEEYWTTRGCWCRMSIPQTIAALVSARKSRRERLLLEPSTTTQNSVPGCRINIKEVPSA
jgi:hypothetical protein